ncbi:RagB/SusD family nutrient uptake outer membrane protein [Flavivirga abyssicola]|uniref:RagB/SusD family nutrient uptake outer membrane protein n=1 Tax=Flavivirga abyssicola TaxID=3063533 RepID=UPI0026DF56C2|nr:RagB/SusD family nutrient uptake outer membrane protein [Flavivirga sp. MEBiC07777]WVK11662.1 RagB/SusD family nutrient uptake outer membrane protein [Flavivirga sp. MEBiC07777]
MSYKNKILLFLSIAFFVSCEDYLDRTEDGAEFATEDEVWRDRNKINSFAYRLYDNMEWMFETRYDGQNRTEGGTGKNYGSVEVFSGDVLFLRPLKVNDWVLKGDYISASLNEKFANPDFYVCWFDNWETILVANSILDRIDEVTTDIMPQEEIDLVKGEALLFRAMAYHELHKRWGPMPYIKTRIFPDTELNLPRPTNRELIADIIADCDAAIAVLPEVGYLFHPKYMGRVGKAAAMGLKSKAITTAASPNYTAGNQKDNELWEMAAAAAWDLIEIAQNSDKVGLFQGDYSHIFHTEPGTIEGVWPRYMVKGIPDVATLRYPQSHTWAWQNIRGAGGFAPTQEMVDRFETADGWPIDHPNSNYNPQDPYTNRDPRFYKDILYHGAPWAKVSENDLIDMRTEPTLGADRASINGGDNFNSKTGYLVRKLMPPNFNNIAYRREVFCNAPYIRMAEIYLNYAEAVNEAYGPNASAPEASLSAVDALNAIRNRVGQVNVRPEFTTDAATFRDVVRNEFRVELAFEYHSWFDMMRWRTAHIELNGVDFHGVRVIEDLSQPTEFRYEKYPIRQGRVFEERQYRYPIRERDRQVYEMPNLTQNPGW